MTFDLKADRSVRRSAISIPGVLVETIGFYPGLPFCFTAAPLHYGCCLPGSMQYVDRSICGTSQQDLMRSCLMEASDHCPEQTGRGDDHEMPDGAKRSSCSGSNDSSFGSDQLRGPWSVGEPINANESHLPSQGPCYGS